MIKERIQRVSKLLLLLLLIGMSHYVHAKPVAVEIRSNQGDVVSFDYTITPDYDKAIVTIQFMNVRIKLDNKSSKYKNLQYAGKLEVLFLDGNNFEDGVTVVLEKDNTLVSGINSITFPEGWEQSNHTIKTKATIFVINDTGEHKLRLNLGQQKGRLRIPIYLAEYHYQGEIKILGRTIREAKTTYKVFRECGPLEIELKPKPKEKTEQSSGGTTDEEERQVVVDDSTEDYPEPINERESEALDLIKKIRLQLNDARGKMAQDAMGAMDVYDTLKPDIDRLSNIRSETSPVVQDRIDEVKKDYDEGREKAEEELERIKDSDSMARLLLSRLASSLDSCQWSWSYLVKPFDEIEDIKERYNHLSVDYKDKVSGGVWNQISAFHERIKEKEKKLKPYLIARNVIRGLLGFIVLALGLLGYNRWKNILEQRKMKSFEEMQRKMADRAVSEAKRRARSYTQNKTRQVIGQAKNQGRKAAQSKAQEVASRVRGQKPSSRENPTVGASRANETNDSPPIGRFSSKKNHPPRRPKPGDNGEITI